MSTITAKELQCIIISNPMATNKDIAEAVNVTEQRVWANRGAIIANETRKNKKELKVILGDLSIKKPRKKRGSI